MLRVFANLISIFCSFTREFNLDKDTHLIAETAQGAKFDLAVSNRNIRIVTPLWLSACSKAGKRVDETPYLLDGSTKATKLQPPSTLSQLERLLADYVVENRSIFELHHFYLLGFEEDIELKQKLGKLIRRGKGTIHWEMNESISIMILHDTCEESLR